MTLDVQNPLTRSVRRVYNRRAMHLSAYMKLRNLRDEDVAPAIGKSRVSVSRYRRKLVRPDWKAIDKIEEWSDGAVGPDDWREVVRETREQAVA